MVRSDYNRNENDTEVLNSSSYLDTVPSPMNVGPFAQMECELYCTMEDGCWGCSRASKSYHWKAITDYDPKEHFENVSVGAITRKTGKLNRTISNTKLVIIPSNKTNYPLNFILF